ncbi:hypothetical protein QFC21_000871 [Naganishia friedmannii]|uniref:Uncharacterized protein n=1 Tax=Naganishia friedmannii TaxID=89922 RepID=A0ACC2W7Y7_9TREE|nr:hypothetical protein QFC21_000871 [Naganishia friedmannii]
MLRDGTRPRQIAEVSPASQTYVFGKQGFVAYRMGSDIYIIGTFLGGMTKTESAGLYRARMGNKGGSSIAKNLNRLRSRCSGKLKCYSIVERMKGYSVRLTFYVLCTTRSLRDDYEAAPARCTTIHPKRNDDLTFSSNESEDWIYSTDDSDLEDDSNDEDMPGTEKESDGGSTKDDGSKMEDDNKDIEKESHSSQ